MKTIKVDNDFLITMDANASLTCMPEKFGGLDKNLNDLSYLEFRKFMYKKYYVEEETTQKKTNTKNSQQEESQGALNRDNHTGSSSADTLKSKTKDALCVEGEE